MKGGEIVSYSEKTEKAIRSMTEKQKEAFVEDIVLAISETRFVEGDGGSYNGKEQAYDQIVQIIENNNLFQ
jgi:hypothetical protein